MLPLAIAESWIVFLANSQLSIAPINWVHLTFVALTLNPSPRRGEGL